jgi:hypothetical protein
MSNLDQASRKNKKKLHGANGTTEAIALSPRKIAANRQNALKSTGPKSLRGKAYSKRNALKHGLFVNHVTDFEALHEDPQHFEKLLSGLWDQYQPVGKAEEIEVERIAVCCWRLKRAWRYENAVNLAARRDFVRRELNEQAEYCKEKDKEEEALISLLQQAQKHIAESGQVSEELKQRMFTTSPGFESFWSDLDKAGQKIVAEAEKSTLSRRLDAQQRSRLIALYTVTRAITFLEPMSQRRWTNVLETAAGQHAIPNRDVVDKILRYETTIERSLSRALDRLERLQRRRTVEPIAPPLSLHLS